MMGKNQMYAMDGQNQSLTALIEKLESENKLLKQVIDRLPGSIYWKNKAGAYLGRNDYSLEKMREVGFESSDDTRISIINKTDFDLFPPDVAKRYRQHDLEVMGTGKELSIEEPTTLPNGETIIQLSTKRPLYDDQGEVIGVVGNTVDITRLKKIEAALREAKELAEASNLAKTEFMRNMEHDIRTPFSGISGIASYLWEIETDETKKEYLRDIAQCAKELLDYCNSILDFSKIESGMLVVLEKKFHLKKLIDSVVDIEKPAAKHRELKFNLSIDSEIPEILIGDRYRLHRILINLISNAIKFTSEGQINFIVSLISKNERQAVVRFTVQDTGIGIPESKQEFIFEKFSRLTLSNKGQYKGIGLGLRIVKQFMHEMGGEIDLMSQPSQGTQFICTLPFKLPLSNDFAE